MKKVSKLSSSILIATTIVIFASCAKVTDYDREKEIKLIEEFMVERGYDITPTESGLYFMELVEGSTAPAYENDTVTVEYSGYYLQGIKFDGGEFRLLIDNTYPNAIEGFNEAITLMSGIDSEAVAIIPSWIGYGSSGYGAIPGNTPLFFELKLLEIDRGLLLDLE